MNTPTIIIIIGITGDLSRRKLLPAIEKLAKAGVLPDNFRVVGVTRRHIDKTDVLETLDESPYLRERLQMVQMDITGEADYEQLDHELAQIELVFDQPAQRLFYLSIPPQMSPPVVELLGKSSAARRPSTKILLEKPFGVDLESAKDLVSHTRDFFREDQLYRIDHYLAKEMAQNLIVFRTDNSLFRRTWNKDFIEKIEISALEDIGIEGRISFYEQTGALRDVVQSHLLQLAAITLMDPPTDRDLSQIPAHRLKALKNLHIPYDIPLRSAAKRAQYSSYADETANPGTTTETFASVTLWSEDSRWLGVPVTLVTGKALHKKETSIRIVYRKDQDHEANELVITLQPDEGVSVKLWAKAPGHTWKIEKHSLKFSFHDEFLILPEAYEQVLLDAINGNHLLFTSSEEVLESWRIIQPIQKEWALSSTVPKYSPGSTPQDIVKVIQ